ncbi:hypothetical protein I79_024643 [Cricetulus griseus]|uniref:Uncharacterized protein n=1 Tax=Cricetulus griseus TaxID=10029 RepID=G3IL81_CRIGR|nr:hypothetical protein I79_024643 [Cricetulus griseus]
MCNFSLLPACFEALQEAFPRRQFVRVMYDTLGDFKHCAHSWNTEAGHLAQGEQIGGEPVHEHCRGEVDGLSKTIRGITLMIFLMNWRSGLSLHACLST